MHNWRGWKYVRPVRKFIQRGRRGWSDEDVWCLDRYINEVTGNALLHLAETSHGYQPEFETYEEWQKFLTQMGNDMLGWNDETFTMLKEFNAAREAWLRWYQHFGGYWD